jgi:phosphatidylserine decarboxylase
MSFLQSAALLRGYFLLPHRLLNRGFARLCTRRRPRFAVQAAIALWTRRAGLELSDFEPGPWSSVQEFFLRRLRPGARPIEPGFVSPVDGHVVGAGPLHAGTQIDVKGRRLSLLRVVNGRDGVADSSSLPLDAYIGGHYVVLFLSPRGYHRMHMPVSGVINAWRWLPGRFFPQNVRALSRIDGVYERNERVVLRCAPRTGGEFLMVLVGASLVGGIAVDGIDLDTLQRDGGSSRLHSCELSRQKGQELGHFRFGSTVILLWPAGTAPLAPRVGDDVRMGQTLLTENQ